MSSRSRNPFLLATFLIVLLGPSAGLAQPLPPVSPAAPPPPSALPPLEGPRPPADIVLASDQTHVESVTFDDAVARALSHNPTIGEAVQEVRRFHALMEQVRANSLPTLIGTGTYTRLDHDRVSNGIVFVPSGSLYLAATLTVPVIYPRGWLTWSEAGDLVDVAQANEKDVRRARRATTPRRTTSSRERSGSEASATGSTRSERRRSSRPKR
jgi:Outer membrane efflux protein